MNATIAGPTGAPLDGSDDPEQLFLHLILLNPSNRALLARLPRLGPSDAWLVAGCLYQTVWNIRSGRPPEENIADYDIFYFDDDLSYEAEDFLIGRARELFHDIPARVDVKNQARVHLWYERRFGPGYPRLSSCRDGVDRFLIDCTRVAVRLSADGAPQIYAPGGLRDLFAGILRPNGLNLRPDLFRAKAESLEARWPWLVIAETPG